MAEPIPSNGGWQNCNWRKSDNAKTKNYGDSRGQVHDGLFKFLFGASQVGVEGFEHKKGSRKQKPMILKNPKDQIILNGE